MCPVVTLREGQVELGLALSRACERSGKRSGAGRKPTSAERSGAERDSKNEVERERSGSGRSSAPELSGERAKSAAQNPLQYKTTKK